MASRSHSAPRKLSQNQTVFSIAATAITLTCANGCGGGGSPAAGSSTGGLSATGGLGASGVGGAAGGGVSGAPSAGAAGLSAGGGPSGSGGLPDVGGSSGTSGSSAAGAGGGSSGSAGASPQGGGSGQGGAGGSAGIGGAAGMAGAVAGFASAAPLTGLGGTATRPTLSAAQAGLFTTLKYLARAGSVTAPVTDNWDPTAGVTLPAKPTFSVAAGGTYPTVQSAIDAAGAGTARVFIQIAPGTYPEQVCIKSSAPPITLYSTNPDATMTVIQHADFQGGLATFGTNSCGGDSNQGASTLDAFNAGFQAKNLTIINNVTTAQINGNAASQATALSTTGDKVVLDNVQVLSHQDTLYVDAPKGTIARVYLKSSYIAGDVDFIFGAATAVFDQCTIKFVSDRKTSGQPLAPDTDNRNAYGFLVVNSSFSADAATPAGAVGLGRAWDHNCTDTATYASKCVPSGAYPNGQATVSGSTITAAYSPTTPWNAAATTKRGYSSIAWACVAGGNCPANRFYEYGDSLK